jgi:methylmalonyl-CoA/ethylmalonyl-CoA epimerase
VRDIFSKETNNSPQSTNAATRLHHIGFVVPHLSEAVEGFISGLQMRWDQEIFYDPIQTVKGLFLEHSLPGTPMIELLEPAGQDSRVVGFLTHHGPGLHHLCYEVGSLGDQLQTAVSAGGIMLLGPSPAIAFKGREIAWVCTRERLLTEYLQRDLSTD